MTPQQAIAMLDRQLATHGQTVTLRKSNSATDQVAVKGFVRGFRPEELVAGIKQSDKKIIISPTGLADYGMPTGGFVLVDGTPRAIQGTPELFKVADQVVRIEIRTLGG